MIKVEATDQQDGSAGEYTYCLDLDSIPRTYTVYRENHLLELGL